MEYRTLITTLLLFNSIALFSQEHTSTETDPVNITAQGVINKYIYAIGGMDKFKSVKDRTTVMKGSAMGQPVDIIVMQKYSDKLFQELKVGEVKQLLYYSNGNGTMLGGTEKTEIEKKELERLMMDATMQLLLNPDSFNVKADYLGIERIDSIDCYAIKLTLPSGIRWLQYYSMQNDLKFKETTEIQTKQGLFEQETYYSDYREVSGLKFPFTIKQYFGLQEIELTVTSIKVNTGLDDSVFELP